MIKAITNKICSVKNCNRNIKSSKLCGMHYQRKYRGVDLGTENPLKKPNGTYSKYINGKQIFHLNYHKTYLSEGRKKDPDFGKSINLMNKMRFSGLKELILKRDNYMCQVCGMTDQEHTIKYKCHITVDHKDQSGRNSNNPNNTINNLWTLCKSCHGRKDSLMNWYHKGKYVDPYIIERYQIQ